MILRSLDTTSLYRVCNTVYKLCLLNLLFLVFCIPLITVPAASAALFFVTRKHVYHEEPAMLRSFWKGFRENWRQASFFGVSFVLIGYVWWTDAGMLMKSHLPLDEIASLMMLIVGAILLSCFVHAFPLMVHVNLSLKQLIVGSFKLSWIKPHLTLLTLILLVVLLCFSIRFTFLFVLFSFSSAANLTYWLVNKKFECIGLLYQKQGQ